MFTFAHGHIYHGVCTTEYVHPNAKVYSVCMSQAAECVAGDSRQHSDGLLPPEVQMANLRKHDWLIDTEMNNSVVLGRY
jgi:hypothetical protein